MHHDPRTGRVIVFAAIDNLWKGAASQAVQNLNLMFGLTRGRVCDELALARAAVLAHFEGIQQVVHRVAKLPLVLNEILEPVEIAAGTVLDQRSPQIDQLFGGRGGAMPVSRSRTIIASASSIGASARSVI